MITLPQSSLKSNYIGYIRLHRKMLANEILRDGTALIIFIWLLLKVDWHTGKKIIGRFWASEELGLKPSTFYKALKRLEKKWQMITLNSNNKFTETSIINWHKYQSGNTSGNNQVTTKEQQSNTLKEYKNIRIKNTDTKVSVRHNVKKIPSINDITESDLIEISEQYKVSLGFVRLKLETLANYCASTGKPYINYKAALRNFVLKDMQKQVEKSMGDPSKRSTDARDI